MNHIDTTWLCCLLIASGKISARDVAPDDLENFEQFVATTPRKKLIDIEDAIEFAYRAMSKVPGENVLDIVFEIGEMRKVVCDAIYEHDDVKKFVESLTK